MKNLLCHAKCVNFQLVLLLSLCTRFSACEIRTNQRSNSLSFSSKSLLSTLNSSGVGPGDAVIIVDHGSNRKEANLMLSEFVEMFRNKTGYKIVEPAHMHSCVQQGAHRVIISPFFLAAGKHFNEDIPALSAEAAKQTQSH